MFKVGDVVRLNRGWTPMIVLHIGIDNEVWAKYASRSKDLPLTKRHYKLWRESYSYHRPQSEFTAWESTREPINTEWNYIMPHRYRNLAGNISGILQGRTTCGKMIIESDSGTLLTFNPTDLVEDIPETFRAKSVTANYSCHYEYPKSVAILVGDIIVSDSGNMYRVMEANTKYRNPKGVFKGCMVSTVRFNNPGE